MNGFFRCFRFNSSIVNIVVSIMYLVLLTFAVASSTRPQYGSNELGYTFLVREGSSVTFDREPKSLCSETFEFPNVVSAFAHSRATNSKIVPCGAPSNASELMSFAQTKNITATTFCTYDDYPRFKLVCFLNSVAVSRRFAVIDTVSPGEFTARVPCDNSSNEAVVLECAQSVQNFLSLKEIKTFTDEPAEAPNDQTTEPSEENRQLGMVSGRNQAGYAFDVFDGGIVKFLPRVGEECTESYILEGLSTPEQYNAVARSTFTPCTPLESTFNVTNIDPSWDILVANVDCRDPIYITIGCRISFNESKPVDFGRTAIRQAFSNTQYLSTRVSCDAPSNREKVECASIAKNYMEIMAHVPN